MRARELPWFRIAALAGLLGVVGLVVMVVRGSGQRPDEVQAIAWNREPCAHCQMLIGEPRHAAQLITAAGDLRSFDDPACALRYIDERRVAVHALWFHHGHADRWLAADEVAFTTGAATPMGSGLLAVDRGTPGTIDLATARARVRAPSPAAAMDHGGVP